MLMTMLQRLPSKLVSDYLARDVSVVISGHKACSFVLNRFELTLVFHRIWIPCRCGILKIWADQSEVCSRLDVLAAHVKIASYQPEGSIGFCHCSSDVSVPLEVRGQSHTKIFLFTHSV